MKASQYNLAIGSGDRLRLVNLLSRSALTLSGSLAAEVKSKGLLGSHIPPALRSELAQSLFIVPDNFDERELIRQRHLQDRASSEQLSIIVAPTIACNMSCHYCFEKREDGQLSSDTSASLLKLVSKHLGSYEGLHVQWFGGEPLLALDQIRHLSRELAAVADRAGKPYAAEITTNGVLMTPEVTAALVISRVTTAQITLEGAKRFHDRVRFGAGREGSFDRILENARQAAGQIEITARIHVAPYSVESVEQLLGDLAAKSMQGVFSRIYFAPLFNYKTGGSSEPFQVDDRRFLSSEAFAGVQASLTRAARSLGFAVSDALAGTYAICTAIDRSSLVVNPDGTLTKCYMDVGARDEVIGSVAEGVALTGAIEKWHSYDFAADPECERCTFLPVCMGGCPKQRIAGADKSVVCTPLKYNWREMLAEV